MSDPTIELVLRRFRGALADIVDELHNEDPDLGAIARRATLELSAGDRELARIASPPAHAFPPLTAAERDRLDS